LTLSNPHGGVLTLTDLPGGVLTLSDPQGGVLTPDPNQPMRRAFFGNWLTGTLSAPVGQPTGPM